MAFKNKRPAGETAERIEVVILEKTKQADGKY